MQEKKIELLTLDNLGNGIVRERFEEAIQVVAANISDINTPSNAARKITLEVTIKPIDDTRNHSTVEVDVKTKLAKEKPVSQIIYIGEDRSTGKFLASIKELDQEELEFDGEGSRDLKLAK